MADQSPWAGLTGQGTQRSFADMLNEKPETEHTLQPQKSHFLKKVHTQGEWEKGLGGARHYKTRRIWSE